MAITAESLRATMGIPSQVVGDRTAVEAARALPPPLLNAYALLSGAVRGFGISATVTSPGARRFSLQDSMHGSMAIL